MTTERVYVGSMSSGARLTADELLRAPIPDKQVELVRGRLVVGEPPGYTHGRVAMRLAGRLAAHLERTAAPQVLIAETGFVIARDPDTVRGPDLAVVRRERIPHPEPRGFLDLAPDLIVEVLSPNDRAAELLAKVADWLSAGATLVWIIDPERRVASVYRPDGRVTLVTEQETLEGEHAVPGFSCPLASIL